MIVLVKDHATEKNHSMQVSAFVNFEVDCLKKKTVEQFSMHHILAVYFTCFES